MTGPNSPRLGRPDRDRGEPSWWLEWLPEMLLGALIVIAVVVVLAVVL